MDRLLILGGRGLLGNYFCTQQKPSRLIFYTHGSNLWNGKQFVPIDINDYESLLQSINKLETNYIINCIGYTNIELCEKHKDIASTLNSVLPENLAKISAKLNVNYIQISTDQLFNGRSPYKSEVDQVTPLNYYAASKRNGEIRALSKNQNSLILRTNFYGKSTSNKKSFSDIIIESILTKKVIRLFTDVYFTPISMKQLLKYIYLLTNNKAHGIYNLSSDKRLSKLDFGYMICDHYKLDKRFILSGSLAKRNDLVIRPLDMSLSNRKLKNKLNLKTLTLDLDGLI